MAKLNLNNQPENPFALAIFGSVGVLMCLVVTVMGIKLWWFKHRLSFEQTTIQNGAAGGGPPNVVVTRRQKKSKFSKDKRWSQQVYSSVDVHGVFKQKNEDDLDIQQPTQLPPVRLRQADSAPSLLLAPPRNKRRPQYVQSTAFEELSETYEQTTPPPPAPVHFQPEALSNTSQATISRANEKDQGISLTFEEVEKELKPQYLVAENVVEVLPEAPKRLNRSSSAAVKPDDVLEKPRFLKSSQSISVPEFRKVIERRPTGFHRPTEDDLTKIDDLEEPQFEKFGDRRPTGYIKYEEVDFEAGLRDFRPLKLNESRSYEEMKLMYDSGHLENASGEDLIEALRNEKIIYQNPTSPDIDEINKAIEDFEKSSLYSNNQKEDFTKCSKYQYNDLSKTSPPEYAAIEKNGRNRVESKENNLELYGSTRSKAMEENFRPQTGNGAIAKKSPVSQRLDNTDHQIHIQEYQNNNESPDRIVSFNGHGNDSDSLEKFTLNQRRPTAYVQNQPHWESDAESEYEENQNYSNTLATASPRQELPTHISLERNYSNEWKPQVLQFDEEEMEEKFTLNQRRPTEYATTELNYSEEVDTKPPAVKFEVNSYEAEGNEDKFTLNQRRPTSYPRSNEEVELQEQTVRFDTSSLGMEGDDDKSTLNQRRPTAFVRYRQEEYEDIGQHSNVTFDLVENVYESEGNEEKFTLNQRRPTGFITAHQADEEDENIATWATGTPINYQQFQGTNETHPREDKDPRVQFNGSDITDGFPENIKENHLLNSHKPTAFARKSQTESAEKDSDTIWQELEKDIESDFAHNIEEEFSRIRQSFELNEADFLELKDELQLSSPTLSTPEGHTNFSNVSPNGFGKTIDDDWENFENLKKIDEKKSVVQDHQEIRITFDAETKEHDVATVSILKETKFEPADNSKPRKSKVTFDWKTEEHLIPARKSPSDEEDTDYDDDGTYHKHPPPVPMQRFTSLNYTENHFYEPVVVPPTTISLFGSKVSPPPDEEAEVEDSWSAIRKHRHLTSQFQHLTLDSPTSPPPPTHPPPPLPTGKDMDNLPAPKPAYRNPLAQLAVERAREVRAEMDGFKGRSIKDAKKMQAQRSSQEFVNLRADFDDTEA